MPANVKPVQNELFFSTNFLKDHAGQIIVDPRIAITELVANAYDAGATKIEILWPDNQSGQFSVVDNGTGLTQAEFNRRWKQLSYDRLKEQGEEVEFPRSVPKRKRTAFGRNGKGRHAAFCFADSYLVETMKAGSLLRTEVSITDGGNTPFTCTVLGQDPIDPTKHGTTVSAQLTHGFLLESDVFDVLGNRFIVDPSFVITVNGKAVKLFDLQNVLTEKLPIDDYGEVEIHILDSLTADRTSKLKGLTWWVNTRMVGEPSWDGLDGTGSILDGRTSEAKRFSFIIQANVLLSEVKPDWSGFNATLKSNTVRKAVRAFVIEKLDEALSEARKQRKKAALEEHRHVLREMPDRAKKFVAQFVEEVQQTCPRISDQDLRNTVDIYMKLEQSRYGYDILRQLADCSPDDLDGWTRIMDRWSASSATIVLNELGDRLTLLQRLQSIVNLRNTDELHDLQPLFERGLWMFGPEYEAVDFRSNRGMSEVIKRFFKVPDAETSTRRPDFVALADYSIGAYSADAYDDNGEVLGCRKVLIVELKRGGFNVTQEEVDQSRDYIREIRAAGCVDTQTRVEAYILGSSLEAGVEEMTTGGINFMKPVTYNNLLNRAHARTFHLHRKLSELAAPEPEDLELNEVLQDRQSILFNK